MLRDYSRSAPPLRAYPCPPANTDHCKHGCFGLHLPLSARSAKIVNRRTAAHPCETPSGRSLRSCERIAEIAGLTDESVCPTLVHKGLRFCGAGAFASPPI